MMVKSIGDNISISEYNSLVYLLRKFKKLVKHETIDTLLKTDIGTFNVTSGFINVGENFILENDVNIISQNCLPLSTYFFTFYIVNTNTSETVIETPVTLSADTDKYGNLKITIPENLLSTGEEIRREIKIEVTFLENEGVSPTRLFNIDLTSDKKYITVGEHATVKATLTDDDDEPLENYTVYFEINDSLISRVTNSDGEAELNIYGSGENGVVNIKVLNEEINIIDAYFIDNYNNNKWWNQANNWGVLLPNRFKQIYLFSSDVSYFIASTSASTSTSIPLDDLVKIPTPFCVEFSTGNGGSSLDKVPLFVLLDSNGNKVFDFQLDKFNDYRIMVYEDVVKIWVNDVYTEYTINTSDYLFAGFWSKITGSYIYFKDFMIYSLVEAEPPIYNYGLNVSGNSIIESGDSTSIIATLTDVDTGVAVAGKTLSYQIKKDSTVLDSGSGVTDANGELDISYSGTGVGDVNVIVSFGSFVQKTYKIEDCIKFVGMTSDISSQFVTTGTNISYSSNGATLTSSWSSALLNLPLNNPVEIEFEITNVSNSNSGYITLWKSKDTSNSNNQFISSYTGEYSNTIVCQVRGTTVATANVSSKTGIYRLKCYSDRIEYYKEDTLLTTVNEVVTGAYWSMASGNGNGRSVTIKNLKVKTL